MKTSFFMILTIILIDFLTGMEFDLFVPSFPELQNDFQLSPFEMELALSINFLSYFISLCLVASMADTYDRKPMILIGLLTFILGSTCCLLAHTYFLFLFGRLLQGIGIAAPAALSFLIITDLYPIQKQQFLLAMLNGSQNTAVAFAPVIGSYITRHFHWEGNFITLLWCSTFTFFMTLFFIPNQSASHQKIPFFQGYRMILTSKIALLLLTYFAVVISPYWIFVGISPLLYMKSLHVSLTDFGYYQGSLAFCFALGSLGFGWLIPRYNQKKMLSIAHVMTIISLILMIGITLKNTTQPLLITLVFICFTTSQIMPINILYPVYLNLIPGLKGRLTALAQGSWLMVAACGLQITGYVYQGTFYSIGIITSIFIFLAFMMMFYVLRDCKTITHTL